MEYDKQTKNRLRRIEGQIRGILRMMEKGEECDKVINQLSAANSALNHTMGVIVSENLKYCLINQTVSSNNDDLVKQAVKLLVRSRKY
ncbi:MAG: metal-sensitive transcriptional regulator [Bacillus sp. (in: Bacteria)]|nr:metal-sensitive transcriptional regulator [Bacillus sp. (in: firmicutes)]